jgi:hypothetical protein
VTTGNGQAPPREKPWQELEEDKRKSDATDVGIRVTYEGTAYEIHFGELSGLDVRELRKQTGYTTFGLLNTVFDGNVDIDVLAAIVWLARRMAGETLAYDVVAGGMKWGAADKSIEFMEAVPDAPPVVTDVVSGEAEHPQA